MEGMAEDILLWLLLFVWHPHPKKGLTDLGSWLSAVWIFVGKMISTLPRYKVYQPGRILALILPPPSTFNMRVSKASLPTPVARKWDRCRGQLVSRGPHFGHVWKARGTPSLTMESGIWILVLFLRSWLTLGKWLPVSESIPFSRLCPSQSCCEDSIWREKFYEVLFERMKSEVNEKRGLLHLSQWPAHSYSMKLNQTKPWLPSRFKLKRNSISNSIKERRGADSTRSLARCRDGISPASSQVCGGIFVNWEVLPKAHLDFGVHTDIIAHSV